MRFARHVIAIWVVAILLLGAVLLYSRLSSPPNDLEALGLGLCDGQPCFMGIIPGVSTWEDVTPILKRFDDLDTYGLFASGRLKDIYINITSSTSRIITSVEFVPVMNNGNLGVSLRAIMQGLGAPCVVGFLRENSHPRLIFPAMSADVLLDRARLTDAALADYLLIIPKNDAVQRCTNTSMSLIRWKGFAALGHYLRRN